MIISGILLKDPANGTAWVEKRAQAMYPGNFESEVHISGRAFVPLGCIHVIRETLGIEIGGSRWSWRCLRNVREIFEDVVGSHLQTLEVFVFSFSEVL